MKFELVTLGLLGMASASPAQSQGTAHSRRGNIFKRQVPQEHSHEIFLTITREFLNLNNPKGISDPVFGLLGDAAASKGAGKVTNLACLKQETADQAFTNAKKVGDIRGMSAALVYQALERNTGSVGGVSAACTDKPVNPEIGAFAQHQDAAGPGALAGNKAIALALAKQLALIGGDPLLALESGTFVAGDLNDRTAAGKSCDSANDPVGCIFTQRLLLLDATPDEIKAAVKDVVPAFKGTGQLKATHIDFAGLPVAAATGAVLADAGSPAGKPATTPPPSSGNAAGNAAGNAGNAAGNAADKPPAGDPDADECEAVKPTTSASRSCTVFTTTLPAGAVGTPAPAGGNNAQAGGNNAQAGGNNAQAGGNNAQAGGNNAQAGGNNAQAGGNNIQAFTGTLGGAAPPVIKGTGDRPFSVKGNTFTSAGAALSRSCDIQHNACANAANTGKLTGGVGQCETQNAQCHAANSLGKRSTSRERFLRERRQATPATGNFGSCTDPSIKFAAGLDGRKEAAFIPNNLKDFGHGSAQKVGIIAGFICQRLSDSCKAPAAVQASCAQASAAAIAAAQNQAAADAFNGILIGKAAAPPPKATPTPTPAGGAAAAITPAPAAGEDACPPPAPVVVTITKCT
ncbi:hypothetical protein VD0004_g6090 [Verticillium dahliae]|nr:hypothetical protein VD0004_g6090 [Verticillium dahliae]PNH65639.1 hypothetical protein VD0001_g8418 [Verticillium dahliae]